MINREFKAVQSCITSIAFPDNIDKYKKGLEESGLRNNGRMMNDVDHLTKFGEPNVNVNTWSAPVWLANGDIMFFYMTKSYKKNVKTLRNQMNASTRYDELVIHIERANDLANLYSGTIFACAEIADSSFYSTSEGVYPHFEKRIYAPLKNVTIFENPVSMEEFRGEIRIGQGTITSLFGEPFEYLVSLLGEKNRLPLFLENKKAEEGFKGIDQNNYIDKACGPGTRFLNEQQFRTFFVDYFLKDLKDEKTPLLRECGCYKQNQFSGRADYFISLDAEWIPVEAKINIEAEKDIRAQILQYINLDYFTDGEGKTFEPSNLNICLLIDQSGLYITSNGEFLGCKIGSPYWERVNIKRNNISEIGRGIIEIIEAKKGRDV